MNNWILVHSKPRKEEFLYGELLAREIECFYPRIRVKPVNPRARKVLPYFPGYMFVNIEINGDQFKEIAWLPGSNGWVHFGSEPASVPDNVIHGIRRHVNELNTKGERTRKPSYIKVILWKLSMAPLHNTKHCLILLIQGMTA